MEILSSLLKDKNFEQVNVCWDIAPKKLERMMLWNNSANMNMFLKKETLENHRNTRKRCKILSKLKKHQKDVIDIVLMSSLLSLNILHTFFQRLIVDFEQLNVSLVTCWLWAGILSLGFIFCLYDYVRNPISVRNFFLTNASKLQST